MGEVIDVIRPGSRVTIGGDVEATVLAVMLMTDGGVQYKVCWWSGRERHEQWIDPAEIGADDGGRMKVGFARADGR